MTKPEKKIQDDLNPAAEGPELSPEVKKMVEEVAASSQNEKVAELEAKIADMKDAMMRTMADAENTRKRAAKEVEDANKYGISTLAKDLISVLENLQRTIDATPAEEAQKEGLLKTLFEGVDMTRKELISIFDRRAIKRIEPKAGEKFDHNLHQAIAQIEDHNYEQGSVLQVVQAGYIIHDRLLRPAMVTVSKAPAGHTPEQNHQVDTTA